MNDWRNAMQVNPERRIAQIYRELARKARYLNGAWVRLENLGFTADYSPADAGEYFNERNEK